jgi:hypothetical protein
MDINKEAEEYAHNHFVMQDNHYLGLMQGFIAGVNSKYAQAEKLKFAIEAVLQFRKATFGLGNSGLEQLQQQLKELEDN